MRRKADAVKNVYQKSTQSGVLVSEGIKTRNANSEQRESVLEWITEKKEKRSVDDLDETGNKYFISEDGRLFATLGVETSLDDPIVSAIINTKVPQANLADPAVGKDAE